MRAVGYCCVDLADANPREHLVDQREAIASEATRRGWELLQVFEDIAGGQSLLERRGLHRALAAVESRQARALIVTDVARLSTSLAELAWLLRSSRRRAWTLVSIAEQVSSDDPATGPLLSVLDTFVPVIGCVTFDCRNPDALADFWAAATGYRKESSPEPDAYAVISDLSSRGRHCGSTRCRRQRPRRIVCMSI